MIKRYDIQSSLDGLWNMAGFVDPVQKGARQVQMIALFASWLPFAGFHKAAGAGKNPENLWRSDM